METPTHGKSICSCGHVGDVSLQPNPGYLVVTAPNTHGGIIGHGPCNVAGCDCPKFTWAGFLAPPASLSS